MQARAAGRRPVPHGKRAAGPPLYDRGRAGLLRADALDPVEPNVSGDAPLDFFVGRPAAADTHDRHRPAEGRGNAQRRFRRTERDHRYLVLGHSQRDRLVGILEVDHLGHEPAAIDGIVEIVLVKNNADRIFGGVDACRADGRWPDIDLGDRKKLGLGTLRRSPRTRRRYPTPRLRPTVITPPPSPTGTGMGKAGASTSTFSPGGP